MTCPDCKGTGEYIGLHEREPCRTCALRERVRASLRDYQKVAALRELARQATAGYVDLSALERMKVDIKFVL